MSKLFVVEDNKDLGSDLKSQGQDVDLEKFKQVIGSLIKRKRKILGLTQVEAARQLSINYRHYQDIEGGKVNMKIDTLISLFIFYKINISKFFDIN